MDPEQIKEQKKALRKAELKTLPSCTLPEVQAVFDKWMLLPDRNAVKFLLAYYCTNYLAGPALWMVLIGPSGGGKTQLLNALLDLPDIVPISILTPNTFLSGMPGSVDASLLPKLDGKIMMMKDLTTLLSMQRDARAEIQAQLREIYDGSMTKIFGNGKAREWTGRVSFIAASTQAIDLNQQATTHLGERFLNYRLIMPDRKEVAMRALNNDSEHDIMDIEIANATFSFFKGLDIPALSKLKLKLPDEYKVQIVNLAHFMTMARSGIIRDLGMKKEVIFVPAPEMPTRAAGQLAKLAAGLMMVNGGVFMEEDLPIIFKCALDSIPQTNKMVIVEMAKSDEQSTAEIASALGYPTEPIRMYLENLAMLRVCKRIKQSGRGDRWTLEPEFADIIREYEGVEELTEEQRKMREVDADEGDPAMQEEFENYGV